MWTVTAYGHPATKGSLKCIGGRDGRHQLIEDDKPGTKREWRTRVAAAARAILAQSGKLTGPVGVRLDFTVARPASATRRVWPYLRSAGDLDKLVRLVLDAITDAQLWGDDSQCCQLRATKQYANTTGTLTQPGVRISIWRITDDQPTLL